MKWTRLALPPTIAMGVITPLVFVACGSDNATFEPPSETFVNAVLAATQPNTSQLLKTYHRLFVTAYPGASAAELTTRIRESSPQTLTEALAAQAQITTLPTTAQQTWLEIFRVLPVAQHQAALLWTLFMAGASEAWAVDLVGPTNVGLTDFVATSFWGVSATTLRKETPTTTRWSEKLTQVFGLPPGAFDSWPRFEASVNILFNSQNHYSELTTRLVASTTAAALARVDQVLSTPLDAYHGVSEAPANAPGGVSLFNLYRPFQLNAAVPFTIASDDLYLVPNTYRGSLWTGKKDGGQKQSEVAEPFRIPSSATKTNWSEWTEPVFEWGHGDSLYVLFDDDATDGITLANFTRNFFVYDSGAYDDQGGPLYQNYLATGNYINPLKTGYDNDLWIAFGDGKSNAALSQENSLPISFADAMAKVKQQVTSPIYKALEDYYAKGASELFKPNLLKQGLFTYHQVATNAMRVVFHNPRETENPPVPDQVAIKSARFILTNAVGNNPTTPLTQQYATFAFGKLAGRAYEAAGSEFTLAKFD